MSAYGIDVFNFEFWDGPPPVVRTRFSAHGATHSMSR
jgi:hypothetical protein